MANTRNVRRVVRKTADTSVLEFVDGTAVFIKMSVEDWLVAAGVAAQNNPQPPRPDFRPDFSDLFTRSEAAHREDEKQ